MSKSSDQVYVVQMGDTNYFKIGYTSNFKNRIRNIQVDCPLKLRICYLIPGNESLEAAIQRRLSDYVTDGGAEWFRIDKERLDKIIREFVTENGMDELRPYKDLIRAVIETEKKPDKTEKKDEFPEDLRLSLGNVKGLSAINSGDISEALRGNLVPIALNGHISALIVPFLTKNWHREHLIKVLNELPLEYD